MTRARTSLKQTYPAPIMGVDFRIPIVDMPPQYSPFMLNFMIQGGKLRKRHSHTIAVNSTAAITDGVVCIPPGPAGNAAPIIINSSKTDNGTTSTSTPASEIFYTSDWTVYKETLFVAGKTQAYTLNVSTLAWTSAFTYAGSSSPPSSQRRPITSYRERLYVARGFDLEYLGVGAVSGTPTVYSLANLLNGTGIVAIGTFSTSFGVGPEQYLVVVSSIGEIIIFSGAFPASSDWTIVSKLDVELTSYCELVSIPNDLLICAKNGPQLYSIRELLASGASAAQYSLIRPIQPIFYEIPPYNLSTGTFCNKTAAYWPARNSLVMAVQFFSKQGLEVEDIPYFGAWSDYIRDGFDPTATGSCSIIIFVVDLETSAISMHDLGEYNLWGQMRAYNNYVMMPGIDRAFRLFDDITGSYQDYGTTDYHAICCFAPTRMTNFNVTSVKNLVLYSNLQSGHTFQHGITKDFAVKPANFTTYTTAKTDKFVVSSTVLPGSQQGVAFIPQIKESGHNPEPFELYGIDPIFESGGLY